MYFVTVEMLQNVLDAGVTERCVMRGLQKLLDNPTSTLFEANRHLKTETQAVCTVSKKLALTASLPPAT